MNINLVTFAQLKEHLGSSPWQVKLPEASTLKDLQTLLCNTHPEAKTTVLASRFAVNQVYVHDLTQSISESDEIALIPPVSGG